MVISPEQKNGPKNRYMHLKDKLYWTPDVEFGRPWSSRSRETRVTMFLGLIKNNGYFSRMRQCTKKKGMSEGYSLGDLEYRVSKILVKCAEERR